MMSSSIPGDHQNIRDPTDHASPWTILGARTLYDGWLKLRGHTVLLPDGTAAEYEVDETVPYGVGTLVIDRSGVVDGNRAEAKCPDDDFTDDAACDEDAIRVLITRQYRHPLRAWIHELPGGGGDWDETPAAAAVRELKEETGLSGGQVRFLHSFASNPGRSAWPIHVFTADAAEMAVGQPQLEASESIEPVWMGLSELDALILAGEIVDPSLLISRSVAAFKGVLPPIAPSKG